MKTRFDFVSNSSSCSFVVKDPLKFKQKMCEWTLDNGFFDMRGISTYVSCDNKLKDAFKDKEEKTTYSCEYDGKYRFYMELEKICSLSDEELSKIDSIELICDNFEQYDVFVLSILKIALEKSGISVTSENSDHPLLLEDKDNIDGNQFIRNICKAAFNAT